MVEERGRLFLSSPNVEINILYRIFSPFVIVCLNLV